MVATLTIAAAQPSTIGHDVVGNAERHAEAIRAAGARVVAFPEMSLTGYEFDAEPLQASDRRLHPIVNACAESGSVALAGAPLIGSDGRAGIGMLRFDSEGAKAVYRKMWLGSDEAAHYVPGRRPSVIEIDDWRLGLAICKDTGVLGHARATVALGIDVYVAGALEHAGHRDVQPGRARRIASAHGVWVVVASFAGSTGEGFDQTAGESGIWRPDGRAAARSGSLPGEIVRATISRSVPDTTPS